MNRIEVVETLNEYAFDNNIQPVIECLNELLNHKDREEYLDLIFMAIASTQMYGFLSYLTSEEQHMFFDCDYFRSNSYRGIEIPFYNRGQLSFLYELDQNQKVFFSAPTSFGKTSIVTEYILGNSAILNNVLFVVPTNSLLEELFEKYTLYNSKLNLKYSISTNPIYLLIGRNILFLTPERFMSLAENKVVDSFDLIV
ncbi:MAG: DEAD/DEAH box helicase family protein, partial [Paludibacteraceae bacterium]|nr:DEAD/DEAH box helicase family protein [Paludibacteraceae bacterium]